MSWLDKKVAMPRGAVCQYATMALTAAVSPLGAATMWGIRPNAKALPHTSGRPYTSGLDVASHTVYRLG